MKDFTLKHVGIMSVLMVAEITSAFETSMVYAALPTISRETGDPVLAGWLVSGYFLVQAVSAAILGRLGDMYGRRRILVLVLICCALGSLVSATAQDLRVVVLGRAVQGVSGAILPLCFGLVREHMPERHVAFCISLVATMASVGAAVGLVLGGVLTQYWHWSTIFYTTVALPLAAGAGLLAFVPKGRSFRGDSKVDSAGAILFAVSVAVFLFAITRGAQWGWGSAQTLAMLGGGLALGVVWVIYEYRHSDPLINVRLLMERQIALTYLSNATIALAGLQVAFLFVMLMQQPRWTQVGLGLSATMAALLKLPSNVSAVIGAPISGFLAGRRGARGGAIAGAVLIVLGYVLLMFAGQNLLLVVVSSMAITLGVGIVLASQPILIAEVGAPERIAELIGMSLVIRSMFMAIGTQVIVVLLATSTVQEAGGSAVFPSREAFTTVFFFCIAASLACLVSLTLLPRRSPAARLEGRLGSA